MEERKPSFLEQLIVSAATGAMTGAVAGSLNLDDQTRRGVTDLALDFSLNGMKNFKKRDRDGYIPGL